MSLPFLRKKILQKMQMFFAFTILLGFSLSQANAWELQLQDSENLPPNFVLVDKGAKSLLYMGTQGDLTTHLQFSSIHGELEGDKQKEGDLRTPEGVYFITGKIESPLDFDKYGSQAYGLNYPNPIDRLRDKTGHGIWIHSKGQPIENRSTEGCIAVDLLPMQELAPNLSPGTAVLVAQSILSDTPNQVILDTEKTLKTLTQEWNATWAARSHDFFDFYTVDDYEKAQSTSFASFQSTKERLFNTLPWIYIEHGDIHVIQGPDYWVTWFKQLYHAPNLSVEGTRRLYWQPTSQGEMKVVGMEWLPQNFGMKKEYFAGHEASVKEFIEKWRLAWEVADIELYSSFYTPNASQANRQGKNAIIVQKEELWARQTPTSVTFENIQLRNTSNGLMVSMSQSYTDSLGYTDKGIKQILLYPDASSWRIAQETWKSQ